MDQNVLYFFDGKPEALLLYEAFEERVFSKVDGVKKNYAIFQDVLAKIK
ncbi:MAG: hypothetical protein HFI88_12290 [Lachnospiraceae bacterium]|nr:hypothetical protein [Lachnospiraceae bacterium]